MNLRYYVLALVALLVVLYFSRDIRLSGLNMPSLLSLPSLRSPQPDTTGTRHARAEVTEMRQWVREKDALEEWRVRQLTRKGLEEMTESGHWQQPHAAL
jgi:hypothetical protein